MLLSEMPRSICDAAAKKKKKEKKRRGLSYFQSASPVSSSVQSDLGSLCNNIQREDNCWVHAHGLALIFKNGSRRGSEEARVTCDSTQAVLLTPGLWEMELFRLT